MTKNTRLTRETWDKFLEMYWAGKFPQQRLGQAAVNHFGFTGEAKLFYETCSKQACEYVGEMMRDYQL